MMFHIENLVLPDFLLDAAVSDHLFNLALFLFYLVGNIPSLLWKIYHFFFSVGLSDIDTEPEVFFFFIKEDFISCDVYSKF